jgi:hypothetical protein
MLPEYCLMILGRIMIALSQSTSGLAELRTTGICLENFLIKLSGNPSKAGVLQQLVGL